MFRIHFTTLIEEMLTHLSIIPHRSPTKTLQRAAAAAKFDLSHKSLAAVPTISLDLGPIRSLPAPAIGQTCLLKSHTRPLSTQEAPTRATEPMSHVIESLHRYDLWLCESGLFVERRK